MYSGSESPSPEKGKKSDGRRIGTCRQIEKEEVMERLADDTDRIFYECDRRTAGRRAEK